MATSNYLRSARAKGSRSDPRRLSPMPPSSSAASSISALTQLPDYVAISTGRFYYPSHPLQVLLLASIAIMLMVNSTLLAAPVELTGTYSQQNMMLDNPDGYRVTANVVFNDNKVTAVEGCLIGFDGRFSITITEGARFDVNRGDPEAPEVVFTNSADAAANYAKIGWGEANYSGEWGYLVFNGDNTIEDGENFQRARFLHGGTHIPGDNPSRDYTGFILLDGPGAKLNLANCYFAADSPNFSDFDLCGVVAINGATLRATSTEIASASTGIMAIYNRGFAFVNGLTPNVRVSNCDIHHCPVGSVGIMADIGGEIVVEGSRLHDNFENANGLSSGVWYLAPYVPAMDDVSQFSLSVTNCTIHNTLQHGVMLSLGQARHENIVIANNSVFNCGDNGFYNSSGVYLSFDAEEYNDPNYSIQIVQNVCWGNRRAGFQILYLDCEIARENFLFANNISGNNPFGVTIATTRAEPCVIGYNAFKGNRRLTEDFRESVFFDDIRIGTTCKVFEEQEEFALVNETPTGMDWDFHLLIDEVIPDESANMACVNAGIPGSTDPDRWRTRADMGIYGGELATLNFNSTGNIQEDYVLVTDPDFVDAPVAVDVYLLNLPGDDGRDGGNESGEDDSGDNSEDSLFPLSLEMQAFPNPFNGTATVRLALPDNSNGEMSLIDQTGRTVSVIAAGPMSAGISSFPIDGSRLVGGVYYLDYRSPAGSLRQRMVLLK